MTDQPSPPALPSRKKINPAVLLVVAAVIVTLPLLAFAGIFLLVNRTSFDSVDELDAKQLESVRVQLLNLPRGAQNRPDTDAAVRPDEDTRRHADPDVGPANLTREDFGPMLQPLRNAERLDPADWPAAVFTGEIRVRYTDGRGGTVRLYRYPEKVSDPNSPEVVYFKVNSNLYRGGTLKELRTTAEACAGRALKGR